MLKYAGACLRELVRPFPDEPARTAIATRKVESICLVRQKQDEGRQEVAFGARPFILCGLPIRRPTDGCLRYSRRNGRFFLDIVGHPDYGLPFGQDRLIPLWIATQAVRRQSRTIEFGSASQILHEWGLPQNGSHCAGWRTDSDGSSAARSSSERARRWRRRKFGIAVGYISSSVCVCGFDPDPGGAGTRFPGNLVTLSEAFWDEIRTHPVPVEAEVVRGLANNPGRLDLYTWLTWRCFKCRSEELIPLFGAFGLASQLGVQEYERERKFRERLRRWVELVKLYWPECPAKVSASGK